MATTVATSTVQNPVIESTLLGSSDIYHFMKQQDLKTIKNRVFFNKNGNPLIIFDEDIFVNFTDQAKADLIELRKTNVDKDGKELPIPINTKFNEDYVIYYFSRGEENFVLCGYRKNSSSSISIEDMKR